MKYMEKLLINIISGGKVVRKLFHIQVPNPEISQQNKDKDNSYVDPNYVDEDYMDNTFTK